MKVLLVEDEKRECERYGEVAKYRPYIVNLCVANGCAEGLRAFQNFHPDIILLDLEFHEGEGDGISFLKKLKVMKLRHIPYIIVVTNNISPRVYRNVREDGADFIISKSKPDYSPILVLDFAYDQFSMLSSRTVSDNSDEEEILNTIISNYMDGIGVTNGMSGRFYITDALLTIYALHKNKQKLSTINLKKQVYPVVARKYKKSVNTIDQCIRNAIKKAWLQTDVETLAENYTPSVSYESGFPENKDFLFYYAIKLAKEYERHK